MAYVDGSTNTNSSSSDASFQAVLSIPGASVSELSSPDVLSFTGEETLAQPYRFIFQVATQSGTVAKPTALGGMLQSKATLTLSRFGEEVGMAAGIIVAAAYLGGDADDCQHYRLEMAPRLWLMSLNRRSRLLQNMSASSVLNMLAGEYLQTTGAVTSSSYNHPIILQHQESDLHFLERVLHSNGMFYFFRHGKSGESLCAGAKNGDCGNSSSAVELSMSSGITGGATRFECREEIVACKVAVTDYNPEDPTNPLTDIGDIKGLLKGRALSPASTVLSTGGEGQVSYQDGAPGFPLGSTSSLNPAELIASGLAARQQTFSGTSDNFAVHAGGCIRISGCEVDAYNTEYVVTSVRHRFQEHSSRELGFVYSNDFTAILVNGPDFQAPATVNPRISGVRLGIITDNGANDTVLGTSEAAGIYQVKFPLEIDSAGDFIVQAARLATPSAGPDRGFHFPLEVGDEVVVAHHLGDPSRPVIIGALFHKSSAVGPTVATKDSKVLSRVMRSGKGHEVRYDDDDNKSMMTMSSATLDHVLLFDDTNKATSLTTKQDLVISSDGKTDETVGKDYTFTGKGKSTVSVSKDHAFTAQAKSTVSIGDDYSFSGAGKADVSVTGALSVEGEDKGSGTFTGALSLQSKDSITLKVGQASITIASSGEITISATKVTLNATDTLAGTGSTQVNLGGAQIAVNAQTMLKLASGGPTQVKGAVIQLN